jgi:hypothetical protein
VLSAGALAVIGVLSGLVGPPTSRARTADSVRFERGRLPARPERISESRIDARLGHVAAVLSALGTEVWCWSPSDWKARVLEVARRPEDRLGSWRAYTHGRPRLIHVSPEVCAQLTKLTRLRVPLATDESADSLAWSVATLAHEAQHVAGISNEVEAECYGMQSFARAARLLGRSARESRYLASVYWKHWYVWLAPWFRSRECRNGGRLDLHPASERWP